MAALNRDFKIPLFIPRDDFNCVLKRTKTEKE